MGYIISKDGQRVASSSLNFNYATDRFVNKETSFNSDGSIVEAVNGGTIKTIFNADGSITEAVYDKAGNFQEKKTTIFNADGSISEVTSKTE